MSASAPSIPSMTTSLQSAGSAVAPLPPRAQPPTYFGSKVCTNVSIATHPSTTTFLVLLTSWQMMLLAYGTYLMLIFSLTLTLLIHSLCHGFSVPFGCQCSPH